jgi:hypothetical protein
MTIAMTTEEVNAAKNGSAPSRPPDRTMTVRMRPRRDSHAFLYPELQFENDGVDVHPSSTAPKSVEFTFVNETKDRNGYPAMVHVFFSWVDLDKNVNYYEHVVAAAHNSHTVNLRKVLIRGTGAGCVQRVYVGSLYSNRLDTIRGYGKRARRFFSYHPHTFPPDVVHTPGGAHAVGLTAAPAVSNVADTAEVKLHDLTADAATLVARLVDITKELSCRPSAGHGQGNATALEHAKHGPAEEHDHTNDPVLCPQCEAVTALHTDEILIGF